MVAFLIQLVLVFISVSDQMLERHQIKSQRTIALFTKSVFTMIVSIAFILCFILLGRGKLELNDTQNILKHGDYISVCLLQSFMTYLAF